jgi:hypothetical protein
MRCSKLKLDVIVTIIVPKKRRFSIRKNPEVVKKRLGDLAREDTEKIMGMGGVKRGLPLRDPEKEPYSLCSTSALSTAHTAI